MPDTRPGIGVAYVRVTKDAWPRYREAFLAIEHDAFGGTALEEGPEDFERVLNDPNGVTIAALKDDDVVGFTIAEPLENMVSVPGPDNDPECGNKTGFYVTDLEVQKDWRGKGIASTLWALVAQDAARRGYTTLNSNNREGTSTRIVQRMGGRIIATIPNYFNSGETYHYVTMDLAPYK